MRLYKSLVLSTMLYCVELWPLSVTQQKQLEAADHKFQRRTRLLLKDRVRNKEVREKTELQKLGLIIKERRLRLFGHVLWMDDGRLLKQVIHWEELSLIHI